MRYCYLDLFSGIGGFALGAYWAGMKFHDHYFSEVDKYAIGIYKKRFPDAIPLGDCRTIKGGNLPKGRWVITGGFPCQDISVAGNKAGLEGGRSGLFSEYVRIIGEIRPAFAIMENVANLASWFDAGEGRYPPPEALVEGGERAVEIDQYQGIAKCAGSLSQIGYDSEWAVIRASDVGAPHRRDRIWIVAYPYNGRIQERRGFSYPGKNVQQPGGVRINESSGCHEQKRKVLADTNGLRLEYGSKEQNGTGEQNVPSQPERSGSNVADAQSEFREWGGNTRGGRAGPSDGGKSLPDPNGKRCQEFPDRITSAVGGADSPSCRNGIGNYWAVEPGVGRVANGVSFRVDRIRGLGNSVVPQIPQLIWEELKEKFYCD